MNRQQDTIKDKLKQIENRIGVYQLRGTQGEILYIGKSICLRQRVASYFSPKLNRNKKIKRMIHQVKTVEVIYTDTELDALLLECELIQKEKPPYNTQLTHYKNYRYFEWHLKPHVQLKVTKKPNPKSPLIIGPLMNRKYTRYAYRYIEVSHPWFLSRKNTGDNAINDFIKNVLENKEEIDELTAQMESAAQQWAFEKAQRLLEQIKGLRYLQTIYQLTHALEQKKYVGRLLVPEGYKYYYIRKGRLVASLKGDEQTAIKHFKALEKEVKANEYPFIRQEEIDKMLIIERFRKHKMTLIQV